MTLRSIDSPRRRPAPSSALLDNGAILELSPGTVVVAVKSHCDGCQAFLDDLELGQWNVLPLAVDDEIAAKDNVITSRALLDALDIQSAPFFVALDGMPLEVVSEGVPFDRAHLLEILPPR